MGILGMDYPNPIPPWNSSSLLFCTFLGMAFHSHWRRQNRNTRPPEDLAEDRQKIIIVINLGNINEIYNALCLKTRDLFL